MSSRVPRLVASSEGQSFLSLPLDAREGFLLSRIDGVLSEDALRELSGLGRAFVTNSLDKFWSLGLIDFDTPAGATPMPAPAAELSRLRDPSIEEGDDLTPEQRLWCESMSSQLATCTHYELLRVPVDADNKTVKRAYYELASRCHPDRFFRKNLGSYKLRLTDIFGRVTLAHDTLTNRKQREAYDRYLADAARAREIERALSGEAESFEMGEAPTEPRLDAASTALRLARRLVGKTKGVEPPPELSDRSSPLPELSDRSSPLPEQAMDALRRRYHQWTAHARRTQASKYEKRGDEATGRGDWVAAANAYRIAVDLMPDDPEMTRKQQEGQRAADAILCDTYQRQADYEEKSGNFREAARNWCRVARIKPDDAHAHERAAHALVLSDGDLHMAKDLGMRAVMLDRNAAAHRITLANVYLAAGLPLNARRELLAAKQFAPQDATVSAMLRRIAQLT